MYNGETKRVYFIIAVYTYMTIFVKLEENVKK